MTSRSNPEKEQATMPRFYLRITDGKDELKGSKGLDLPGAAAAREEALLLARELKDGKLMPGRQWDGWFVSIIDEHGRQIDSIPIDVVQGFQPLP
jgi:uncharacterized protein DUF6894